MKSLRTAGWVAVVLAAGTVCLAVKAGNNSITSYDLINLGPGSAFKLNDPDAGGTFLVVGSTPDPDVAARATVWSLTTDGLVRGVYRYDTSLGASQAIGVNDYGFIVGSSGQGPFVDVPCVGIRFLPDALAVEALNNQGVVVGFIHDPSGPSGVNGAVWYVDWTGNVTGPFATGIGPGSAFLPLDINDEGTMTGFLLAAGSTTISAAVAEFSPRGELSVTDLGVLHPGDTSAIGWSINSEGVVAGVSSGNKGTAAFLWDPTQPNKLTSLGSSDSAPSINDSEQVVFSNFVWQNGKAIDLNSLLRSGVTDTVSIASGINNAGQIAGTTQSRNALVLLPR